MVRGWSGGKCLRRQHLGSHLPTIRVRVRGRIRVRVNVRVRARVRVRVKVRVRAAAATCPRLSCRCGAKGPAAAGHTSCSPG